VIRYKKSLLITLLIGFIIGYEPIGNAEMQSLNYRIGGSVHSAGGEPAGSTNFQMNSTLGQPSPLMEQGMAPYSDDYDLLPGFWYTISASGTCPGDFDWDFDVDGADLQEYIFDSGGLGLDVFAAYFGKIKSP
jgi:hypothetical protein